MKKKDLLTIATVALGTATLTVAGFWAGPSEAGSEGDTPPSPIAKQRFVSHGVGMTMAAAGGRVFKAGDQPEFELTALNTTDQPATASVCVTMTASAPSSFASRVISLPSVLWQQEQVVSLRPKETKVITLSASKNLPANSLIGLSLAEPAPKPVSTPPGMMVLNFSTVVPKAQPSLVSSSELGLKDKSFPFSNPAQSFSVVVPKALPVVAATR